MRVFISKQQQKIKYEINFEFIYFGLGCN